MENLSIDVIGDAFADVYCFLESGLPTLGGDSRLTEPISTVPGGSALNTTTHLASLIRYFIGGNSDKLSLQTVVNENDVYGKLIIDHAAQHNFKLINRRISNVPSCFIGTSDAQKFGDKSTGHCAVIVAGGDRSFMTHLGCMEDFRGSHILMSSPSPEVTRQHVHISGYFNIPGFWHGELANQLAMMQENAKKENKMLTISLVPQQDATDRWDGGLKEVLRYIDFLILNEVEARFIAGCTSEGNETKCTNIIAQYFNEVNPKTVVIVTMGCKGVTAFQSGNKTFYQSAPREISSPLDPTGAGDAFAAGFLYGILNYPESNKVKTGLQWGCAMGTCDVMVRGASTLCSKQNIETLLKDCGFRENAL